MDSYNNTPRCPRLVFISDEELEGDKVTGRFGTGRPLERGKGRVIRFVRIIGPSMVPPYWMFPNYDESYENQLGMD